MLDRTLTRAALRLALVCAVIPWCGIAQAEVREHYRELAGQITLASPGRE